MASLSRRKMLTSLGALLGTSGLVALAPAAAAAPATAGPSANLTLIGSQMRVLGARGRQLAGTSSTVRGRLHSAKHGPPIGEFFSSAVILAEKRLLDGELGSFETHLFMLADATLTGAGTVHHDGSGSFTITGGSGRFAGARGSYSSVQSADHSGTGEAVFTFEIG